MNLPNIRRALADYHGPPLTFMEICGTHTAAISENGIPAILSPHIHLISGPGCPVCVSVSAYIDRLCDLAMEPGMCVCTFGDLLRVPGSTRALEQCVAVGGRVQMVYSPLEVLSLAKAEPSTRFVFAGVCGAGRHHYERTDFQCAAADGAKDHAPGGACPVQR